MVNGRIRAYLESNNILTPHQNGFRPGRSTADSQIHIIQAIQQGFQRNDYTIAVFIDFKNAFDKVNKSAMLIKLHQIGIRGRMAQFIKNFLHDRSFRVRCGNTLSPPLKQEHGLPQGSVISPTLFLIMINDLFSHGPNATQIKHSLYADDVAFWCTHNNLNEGIKQAQNALNQIQQWCRTWGLTISTSKSVAVIFAKKTPNINHPNLMLNNEPLKYVPHFKYLGVTLDTHLNFNKHFEDIKQRCTRRINILRCIAGREWGADRRTLLQLYTSLIRPILDYNGFLYDDIASSQIDSLQVVQNTALRIVTGAMRTTNTYNLHIDTNLPTLERRRKYLLLRYYLRCLARPANPAYQIITSNYTSDIPSEIERKYPIIGYRIQKALHYFQIVIPPILHFPPLTSQFLPLNQTVDYLFRNNKKHVNTQETLQLLHEYQHNHSDYQFFYTDGSHQDGKTGAGVTSSHYENANRLPNLFSVFSAELSAILHAINYIKKKGIKKSVICTDSLASIQAIAHNRIEPNHIVYLIKKNLYKLATTHIHIKLLWIPGHSGIPGNTRADQLAKNSLQLPERKTARCTHQDAAIEIRAAFTKLRQFDWDSFPHPHLHPNSYPS